MLRPSIVALWFGAAVVWMGPPAWADLPGGTSPDAWLRSGGSVLELQVTPANARVELDGDRVHSRAALVTAGVHLLVIRAPGRREHREVLQVPRGRRWRKHVNLVPLAQTGRLDLRIRPQVARVLIDGRLVAAQRPIVLTAGRHRLQIVATGYRTLRKWVRVPRGATLTIRIDLQPDRRHRRRPRVAFGGDPVCTAL